MGKLSLHKRTKMGQLPGDKSVQVKAAMLEGKDWGESTRCANTFKKDHVKKANRRMRRKRIEV